MAIFIAAILDGIDGRVARLTNTQSEFGVQYDSLADLVSFGMAPALVMYHWALSSMKLDGVTARQDRLARRRSCMPPARRCGWRASTARSAQVDKRWFIGLASPAAAGLVASFVWTCHDLGFSGSELRYVALAVTVVAGAADGQPAPLHQLQGQRQRAEGRAGAVPRRSWSRSRC